MVRRQLLVLVLVLLVGISAQAWDGHDMITTHSLQDLGVLQLALTETEYVYGELDLDEYNPAFVLEFRHPDLDEVSALEVLSVYSSEPDWDFDNDLDVHWLQALTGGSQGWRHQRYTLLGGLIVLGEAPQRAQKFYDLALYAHEQGDPYWAFRLLARSLHFVQDMGQPFHALPMPIQHFITEHRLNLTNATTVAENAHYNLEGYVEYKLQEGYEPFILALTGTQAASVVSVEAAAIELNMKMRDLAEDQYYRVMEVWPHLAAPTSITLDFTRDRPQSEQALAELHDIIKTSLRLTAEYTRGIVQRFLKETGRGSGPQEINSIPALLMPAA